MARIYDQNASPKVTAASTTVSFTATDIPSNGVVAYHFLFTGAGMTFGDVSRIRVKSGGSTIIDVNNAALTQYIARFSKANVVPAAGDTTFTIPLYLPDAENEDAADVSQMPAGAAPTIELVIGAGGAAGTVQVAWTLTDQRPRVFPVLLGSALNIAASATGARYPIFEPGLVQGVCIPTAGLTRLQLVLSGIKRAEIEGTSLYGESQRLYDAQAATTDPRWLKLPGGQPASAGNSQFVADTAAGWSGVAAEGTVYALRSQ